MKKQVLHLFLQVGETVENIFSYSFSRRNKYLFYTIYLEFFMQKTMHFIFILWSAEAT